MACSPNLTYLQAQLSVLEDQKEQLRNCRQHDHSKEILELSVEILAIKQKIEAQPSQQSLSSVSGVNYVS